MPDHNVVRYAWLGLAIIIVGAITALWAVGNLTDGLTELPRHWWSTLAALPIVLGVATTATALTRLAQS